MLSLCHGAGTDAIAACKEGFDCLGIDSDPKMCQYAASRVNEFYQNEKKLADACKDGALSYDGLVKFASVLSEEAEAAIQEQKTALQKILSNLEPFVFADSQDFGTHAERRILYYTVALYYRFVAPGAGSGCCLFGCCLCPCFPGSTTFDGFLNASLPTHLRYVTSDVAGVVKSGLRACKGKLLQSFHWMTELPLILEKYVADTEIKQSSVEQARTELKLLTDLGNDVSGCSDYTPEEEVAQDTLAKILKWLVENADIPKVPDEPVPWLEGSTRRAGGVKT